MNKPQFQAPCGWGVTGSLSMKMRDVTWDEAIDFVTGPRGLLYTKVSVMKVRNITSPEAIRAFPLDQGESLNAEEGSSVVARMSDERLADLRTYLTAVDHSRKQRRSRPALSRLTGHTRRTSVFNGQVL